MLLKLKDLLRGICCWRTLRCVLRLIRSNVLRLDHPRRALAQLASLDDTTLDHAQRCHDAHIHALRRRFKRNLAPLGPFAVTIDGDAVVIAERADPRLGPAVATP